MGAYIFKVEIVIESSVKLNTLLCFWVACLCTCQSLCGEPLHEKRQSYSTGILEDL